MKNGSPGSVFHFSFPISYCAFSFRVAAKRSLTGTPLRRGFYLYLSNDLCP